MLLGQPLGQFPFRVISRCFRQRLTKQKRREVGNQCKMGRWNIVYPTFPLNLSRLIQISQRGTKRAEYGFVPLFKDQKVLFPRFLREPGNAWLEGYCLLELCCRYWPSQWGLLGGTWKAKVSSRFEPCPCNSTNELQNWKLQSQASIALGTKFQTSKEL